MSVEMGESSGEVDDELIDLNKEPVERKRKRVEENNSTDKGNEGSNGVVKSGRVLRSRTVAMRDGEKQGIELEIINIDDEDETEVPGMENKDEIKALVLKTSKMKMKGRRGRPPKKKGKCEVPSLRSRTVAMSNGEKQVIGMETVKINDQDEIEVPGMENEDDSKAPVLNTRKKKMKGRRGRPPKKAGKCEVPSLRSRTVAMSDGEKQLIEMEIVKMDDKDGTDVPGMETMDESKVPVLEKRKKKMKGRRGRPPKMEGKCVVPSLSSQKKKRRGRPPKNKGKSEVSCSGYQKKKGRRGRPPKAKGKSEVSLLNGNKDDKVLRQKKVDGSNNGSCQVQGQPELKRKRGRPPKTQNGNVGLAVKKKIVKQSSDHKESGTGSPVKRLKVGENDLENGVMQQKMGMVDCGEGGEVGLRERKQFVRDQIVAMLRKAGWTVEYRQRLKKEYQDAVYVDREGRTHWSVTLAYKKFKERIDAGKAADQDVLAFTPIPEETLSMLFRITEKGKKAGKKKKVTERIIKRKTKKESSKSKSSDGKTKSRRTLLARRPRNGSDTDDYELYERKRTLLSWMIDLGTVPLGAKVKYKRGRNKRALLEGRITKEGICCDCCNIMYSIRDFESHAESTPGRPYQNIYLDSGNSLLQCLVDSWKKHVETHKIEFACVDVEGDDPNDDTCNVCGDGGDLICCDSCPSTFHHGCLRIKVPFGDWHCVYCSCKFCGIASENTSTTNDDCNLLSELLTCRLCDEKFHLHCTNDMIAEDFDDENNCFCGKDCLKIFEQLQDLLGVRHELGEEFSCTILQHRVVSGDASLIGNSSKVESNSKLAVAFSVMDECFEPIIDERSGTNMIHNVVYSCGSNIRRLNYDGFYTIILEKGDELVAAASIRIHGRQLAEMPFIGTRFMYRRQGMCSRLLAAIEMVLCSLGVEKLVIPAISELNETWTKVFGFHPLEESKRYEIRYMSMIVFPGVDMLQKPVLGGHQFVKGQKDSAASECAEVRPEHQNIKEIPASNSSTHSDLKIINHGEAAAVKSCTDAYDASATESTEVQTRQSEDIEVEIHDNKVADIKSGAALPVGSLNKNCPNAGALYDSQSNGECPNHIDTSKDDNLSLKANMSTNCNLEAQQSAEGTKTCPKPFLSENGNACRS